jgi:hypothetical protein
MRPKFRCFCYDMFKRRPNSFKKEGQIAHYRWKMERINLALTFYNFFFLGGGCEFAIQSLRLSLSKHLQQCN